MYVYVCVCMYIFTSNRMYCVCFVCILYPVALYLRSTQGLLFLGS